MKKGAPETSSTSPRSRRTLLIAGASALLGAAVATGVLLIFFPARTVQEAQAVRESNVSLSKSPYTFIDPLIGIKGVGDSSRYDSMQRDVESAIATAKNGSLISASVDFRDINASGGFVVNPQEDYTPASLNKVPVMMAYLKIAESNPSFLSDTLVYTGTTDSNAVEEIRSPVVLKAGESYTVAELIEHMIRYSDNNAADLLTKHLSDTNHLAEYAAVFSDLGVDPTILEKYTDNMTVGDYSVFLRALYNATYLDRNDSEYALELLSESDFTSGIDAGVPNDVLVAEKFGEVRVTDSSGQQIGKELNNCGIIYYPGHPYLLCIMTKGTGDDTAALETDVAAISRTVYEDMQRSYPQN